jgi:hypothetical protein
LYDLELGNNKYNTVLLFKSVPVHNVLNTVLLNEESGSQPAGFFDMRNHEKC